MPRRCAPGSYTACLPTPGDGDLARRLAGHHLNPVLGGGGPELGGCQVLERRAVGGHRRAASPRARRPSRPQRRRPRRRRGQSGRSSPSPRAGSGRASPDIRPPGGQIDRAGTRRDLNQPGVVRDRHRGAGRLRVELADVRRGRRVLDCPARVCPDRHRVPRLPLGVVQEADAGPRSTPPCLGPARAPAALRRPRPGPRRPAGPVSGRLT